MKRNLAAIYENFGEIGFSAGITLKEDDFSHSNPYELLRSEEFAGSKEIIAPAQVHGSEIAFIDDAVSQDMISVDGVLSRNPESCLTIRTADCLPLLLGDPDSALFGAVHLGWRGLAGGILENLRIALKNLDSKLNRLYISLGPAIGDCCFAVGAEVAILFDDNYVTLRDDRYFLNIRSVVKEELLKMGVSADRIMDMDECTSCLPEKYFSFRRDGHAREQMISFICKK